MRNVEMSSLKLYNGSWLSRTSEVLVINECISLVYIQQNTPGSHSTPFYLRNIIILYQLTGYQDYRLLCNVIEKLCCFLFKTILLDNLVKVETLPARTLIFTEP